MLKDGPVTIVNARGVADKIKPDDIYSSIIEESVSLLIAGEMLISPDSQTAALAAIDVALMAKRKVAISLNNMYFGSGHKILLNADFLFGNLKEFQHNFPSTEISELRNADLIYIITNGSNGAYISGRGNYIEIPAIELVPNEQTAVPSYVGAGDQFAAGFLFGYAHGLSFSECGKLGAETATAIMRAPGARPSGDWTSLASKYLLPEDKDRNSALSSAGAR
jgi:sugar/nucleoside kinase (ribokinase family)